MKDRICINCNASYETETGESDQDQLCPTCIIEFQKEKQEDKLNKVRQQ